MIILETRYSDVKVERGKAITHYDADLAFFIIPILLLDTQEPPVLNCLNLQMDLASVIQKVDNSIHPSNNLGLTA